MDKQEARALLSVHRANENVGDPRFAAVEEIAAGDPELTRWWAEDQDIDRAITARLAAAAVPADLEARLASHSAVTSPVPQRPWRRSVVLAAAAMIALAVVFNFWRGSFQPAASLADYRDEMVSFIKTTPSLEMETDKLDRISQFLETSGAPSQLEIPKALRELAPVGCRVLRFRGNDVTLICFRRTDGHIAHLFVVRRGALPRLPDAPQYAAAEDGWITAAWNGGDYDYLVAVQGDRATAEKLTADS